MGRSSFTAWRDPRLVFAALCAWCLRSAVRMVLFSGVSTTEPVLRIEPAPPRESLTELPADHDTWSRPLPVIRMDGSAESPIDPATAAIEGGGAVLLVFALIGAVVWKRLEDAEVEGGAAS